MKKFIKNTIIILFCLTLCFTASASTLTGFYTDRENGWTMYERKTHMGTKNTTYVYESTATQNSYSSYIIAGILDWDTSINMQLDTNSLHNAFNWYSDFEDEEDGKNCGYGLIKTEDEPASGNAGAWIYPENAGDTVNHVTTWFIVINTPVFDNLSEETKKDSIAHEIGHIYGLDHVTFTTHIMYESTSGIEEIQTIEKKRNGCLYTYSHFAYMGHSGNCLGK